MMNMMSFIITLNIKVYFFFLFIQICLEKHEKLEKHINSYPNGQEITIEFSNMNFKANKNEIIGFFLHDYPHSNPSPITSLFIDYQENNQYFKKGTGRFITKNKDFALFCVKKDGMVKLFLISL